MHRPNPDIARKIIEQALGVSTISAQRFPTGLCHYVYEVFLSDGRSVVARLATDETSDLLSGGIYWQQKLQPLGLPLAKLLHADPHGAFPSMIMERLPGVDLGTVYPQLTDDNKRAIAAAVVDAQARTAHLPEASGFGYATTYGDPSLKRCQNWKQVVIDSIKGSRNRILSVGAVDAGIVDRIERHLPQFDSYFSKIKPTAFLDDTTTKNVLVHEGCLSGIVDVDEICFGDSLQTVGLTQMALLSLRYDTDYILHWLDLINATEEQRAVVDFYTAMYCVGFLSEQGQRFNREEATIDENTIVSLEQTFDELLGRL